MKKKYNILVTFSMMIRFLKKNKSKLPNNLNFKFYNIPQALESSKLKKIIYNFDGLICGDDEINNEVLQKANKLKVISKWGTGIDSIDTKLCKKYNIKIFNTPNAFTDSVSQLVLGFILLFSRNIVETHNQIKKNHWPKLSGNLLKDQIVGIIGLGKIGKKLAQKVHKLGMKIIFYDIKKIKLKKFKQVSLKTLLKKSDYVCISCDLNEKSNKMLDLRHFKIMKKNSSLINVARGKIIVEKDLVAALNKKLINNVALDVYETEPLPYNSGLRKFNNVILSSHNAFNTVENVEMVNINTLKNIIKYFS